MDTQVNKQTLYITTTGDLKLGMSTRDFYVQGIREDMFGQLCLMFTYFKS